MDLGDILVFFGVDKENKGKDMREIRDGFGLGVIVSPWMHLCFFSGRDLMCEA